jgi:hypothetical protein
MDSAAEAQTKHLMCSGGEMRAVDNDARDKWNGAKKVMNRFEKKRLVSGNNALDAALCAHTNTTWTGAVEVPYTARREASSR